MTKDKMPTREYLIGFLEGFYVGAFNKKPLSMLGHPRLKSKASLLRLYSEHKSPQGEDKIEQARRLVGAFAVCLLLLSSPAMANITINERCHEEDVLVKGKDGNYKLTGEKETICVSNANDWRSNDRF